MADDTSTDKEDPLLQPRGRSYAEVSPHERDLGTESAVGNRIPGHDRVEVDGELQLRPGGCYDI